jgi:hypothetical protein
MSSLDAPVLSSGDQILAEDSSIAIDNNKGERRRFLDSVTTRWKM